MFRKFRLFARATELIEAIRDKTGDLQQNKALLDTIARIDMREVVDGECCVTIPIPQGWEASVMEVKPVSDQSAYDHQHAVRVWLEKQQ